MTRPEGAVANYGWNLHRAGMNPSRWKALVVTTLLGSLGSCVGGHAFDVFYVHGRTVLAVVVLLSMLAAGIALVRRA